MSYDGDKKDTSLEEYFMKVTAALYRVTDLLSDNEPMKWKLRADALELLDVIIRTNESDTNIPQVVDNAHTVLQKLVSKLSVVQVAGYISRMNFQVLEQEYINLSDIIFEKLSLMSDTSRKDLLDISIGHSFSKKVIKDKNDSDELPVLTGKNEEIKDRKKDPREPSSTSERQHVIKKALHEQGWLSIKDITALYSDVGVSTKTVQRDLTVLMQSGIVQSKGERRWRKYALAENYQNVE